MIVLIPAYEPDSNLTRLVDELQDRTDYTIVIVDDGSSIKCRTLFSDLESRCKVLHHSENKGKGAAIKTGLNYIKNHLPHDDGIITADADGQHLVSDIIRVSEE